MLAKDPNYRRIPLPGRTLTGRCSYWLAKDHLLVVEVQFATESYRRFALRDIAGMVVRGTRSFELGITVGGVLVLGSAAIAIGFLNNDNPVAAGVTAGVLFLPSLVATLVHLSRGRTAYCDLITAVQTFRLPGVNRQKQAERLIQTLQAATREVEGSIPSPAPAPSPGTTPDAPSAPEGILPTRQPLTSEPPVSAGDPAPGDTP